MHIIAGKFKGYKLKNISNTRIRPTMDRVRESIFSMIRDRIGETVVLDLFAGSGSLGLEALSEGARICHFVDNSFRSIKSIKENLNRLHITNDAKVIKCSALSFIKKCGQNSYDIIFVDPPYNAKVVTKIVNNIYKKSILKQNGLIIAECGIDEDLSELSEEFSPKADLPMADTSGRNNRIIKTKIYGDTKISLIIRE